MLTISVSPNRFTPVSTIRTAFLCTGLYIGMLACMVRLCVVGSCGMDERRGVRVMVHIRIRDIRVPSDWASGTGALNRGRGIHKIRDYSGTHRAVFTRWSAM